MEFDEKMHIFLSHSKRDSKPLAFIYDGLTAAGFQCWVDSHDIEDAGEWVRLIEAGIQECGAMLVIMTENARQSEWVERETLLALSLKKPIFIARFDDTTLPIHLINRQATDFRKRPKQALTRLTTALEKMSLNAPLSKLQRKKQSAKPNEHNFFRYMEQLPEGDVCAKIARDLFAWADTNCDQVSFTGRATPSFHANLWIGAGGVTLFSVRASKRQPTVEISLGRLKAFEPFTQHKKRIKILHALNDLMPHNAAFDDERADKFPNLPLATALNTPAALNQFKHLMADITRTLRENE